MDESEGNEHIPEYYAMGHGQDVFAFLEGMPMPCVPAKKMLAIIGVYVTALRYARRCLWKAPTLHGMADDARKAAVCFKRLADILDPGGTHHA